MRSRFETSARRVTAALAVGSLVLLAACDSLLEVDYSGVILPEQIDEAGPGSVPILVNGIVGSYQETVDNVIRYAALLTDEMIASETFPTRLQVDERRIQVDNSTLEGELYTPLHVARMQVDTTVLLLQNRVANGAYQEVIGELREGIALGRLYGGYARVHLAELYCWSILTGMYPEAAPLRPDQRMQQALTFLQDAEAAAFTAGEGEIRYAAIVGQARAHLWLRNFDQAATLASQVPREFVFWAEYSDNQPGQYNELYSVTYDNIRWTVGDGRSARNGNEAWEHLDGFIGLNLLRDEPEGYTAFISTIPVILQTLYSRPENSVLVASGAEAMLIRAEAAVRALPTDTTQAVQLLNNLRADYSTRAQRHWRVDPPEDANQLQPLTLTGNLAADLKRVADERARELWLTGDRLTTSRRLRVDGLDLFPDVKTTLGGGDDTAFPIPQIELDTNPNLSSADACPPGQAVGSWR